MPTYVCEFPRKTNYFIIIPHSTNCFIIIPVAYFMKSYRPVREGNLFLMRGGIHNLEFKIVEMDLVEYCIISLDIEIFVKEIQYDENMNRN